MEVVAGTRLQANRAGKGKTQWEVSGREPRALITPNHGAFEALPLNPLSLDSDFAGV